MEFMIIAVLVLVATSQAKPYLPGAGMYGPGMYGGGGGYGGGRVYGHSGFNRGDHGFLDEGFGNYGMNQGHDIRHYQNDYDSSVHHHQSSDQNIGSVSMGGSGGHLNSGHGSYGSGLNDYGREFGHGYNNYGML